MHITFPLLSSLLMSVGAILALGGVLLENPEKYINASYFISDSFGMIYGLYDPSIIKNYMRYRNKAFLSLLLIVLGFFIGLPVFKDFTISIWQLLLLFFAIFMFAVGIAGHTRKNIIDKWHQKKCKISWFMKFLDESYYINKYENWKQRKEESKFLENTMTYFKHIAESLDIDIGNPPILTFESVDSIRNIHCSKMLLGTDVLNTR